MLSRGTNINAKFYLPTSVSTLTAIKSEEITILMQSQERVLNLD